MVVWTELEAGNCVKISSNDSKNAAKCSSDIGNKEGVVFKVTKVNENSGWVYFTAIGVMVDGNFKTDKVTVKQLNNSIDKYVKGEDFNFELVSPEVRYKEIKLYYKDDIFSIEKRNCFNQRVSSWRHHQIQPSPFLVLTRHWCQPVNPGTNSGTHFGSNTGNITTDSPNSCNHYHALTTDNND